MEYNIQNENIKSCSLNVVHFTGVFELHARILYKKSALLFYNL